MNNMYVEAFEEVTALPVAAVREYVRCQMG